MESVTKGIILAGGTGSRLFPVTMSVSKQLLPVYDKPMVYYPLSTLMLANIRDILIITTKEDQEQFKRLLGDGTQFGISLTYIVQLEPKGIAEAFLLAENFIANDNVCLVLGDNIFYGDGFTSKLETAINRKSGATVFAYPVSDPHRFGIVEFDENYRVQSIEEKPKHPKSNWAATGLYFYDNDIVNIAKKIKPSARGELEITCVNQEYLKKKSLSVELLGRGFAWLDAGTHESLLEASQFVMTIEHRQGLKVACLEEIAWRKGWVCKDRMLELIKPLMKTDYGKYVLSILEESKQHIF